MLSFDFLLLSQFHLLFFCHFFPLFLLLYPQQLVLPLLLLFLFDLQPSWLITGIAEALLRLSTEGHLAFAGLVESKVVGLSLEIRTIDLQALRGEGRIILLPFLLHLRVGSYQSVKERFFRGLVWLGGLWFGFSCFLWGLGANVRVWLSEGSLMSIPEFAVGEGIVILNDGGLLWVERVIAGGYVVVLIRVEGRVISYYIEAVVGRVGLALRRSPRVRVDAFGVRLRPRICGWLGIIDVAYSTVIICLLVAEVLRWLLGFVAIVWHEGTLLGGIVDLTRWGNVGGLVVLLPGVVEAKSIRLSGLAGDVLLIDREDGVEGGLIDAAADVGLHVEEHFGQREDDAFFKVLHNGVDLKDLAIDVDLPGDVHSLEEVEAEARDILEVADLLLPPVPQDTLVPPDFSLQEGDVSVGLSQVVGIVFDLPKHLDQYLYALGLHYLLSH